MKTILCHPTESGKSYLMIKTKASWIWFDEQVPGNVMLAKNDIRIISSPTTSEVTEISTILDEKS